MSKLLTACSLSAFLMAVVTACSVYESKEGAPAVAKLDKNGKPVVYQVFTRLFGNTNSTNKPWGTMAENGVGKFNDFTDTALEGIKELGVSHVWYTGVLHHAVVGDYSHLGISNDDPDVVKGRAGSPYAIKDYYNVNPDLAVEPSKRLAEFEALIQRTHQHGLKVIIDIVPNHVARGYHSVSKPTGVEDFGASDDTSQSYARDNSFYYVVGESFKVPQANNGYQPLNGEQHVLNDGKFVESPAKWTGNGSRKAQPDINDWYETVKVNFGVRPDGSHDFSALPADYADKDYRQHAAFWADKNVPATWVKFRDIAQYWLAKGVDGFRYDMAEMVPVEFWSYMNSSIKTTNPEAFILAEVYNPKQYRDYIRLGKMDYLYDKVEFYDTLKAIMQGKNNTDALIPIQQGLADIEHHMLHFLENHDEQRIASPDFAGQAEVAKPAMVVSTTISTSPTLLYFGQDVGEDGADDLGFGGATRTSIFDYVGVPAHQRWMNHGRFDGGLLSTKEKSLRDFYQRLLTFSASSSALNGQYAPIHHDNLNATAGYSDKVFSFVRWSAQQKLVVVSNFDGEQSHRFELTVPSSVIKQWQLSDGQYPLDDQLYGHKSTLVVNNGVGSLAVSVAPLASFIYQL
ncbi:MAG: glycosidase [Phenylobacterium sp.]|jgi:glycosidase